MAKTKAEEAKKKPLATGSMDTPLSFISQKTVGLFIQFRDTVCEECRWSLPTYYRKMRQERMGENVLSNAEKDKIKQVGERMVNSFAEIFPNFSFTNKMKGMILSNVLPE